MLDGGIPKGRVILLCGGPGTGKTIFSLQFLASAAERGIRGVYATLEEHINSVEENVNAFSWDIKEKEKNNTLKLVEYRPIHEESKQKGGTDEKSILLFTTHLFEAAKSINAQLLVIDPLTSITINEQTAGVKRRKVAELFDRLRSSGYTTILTSETTAHGGEFYMEEFLADGVIRLDKAINNFDLVRTIRIEKMRGVQHDEQPRRYVIDSAGFRVYNTEPVKA
jgi:circadian clock protein KaiC